ncbi:unnamed protein product [Musa acuminata subsp. malaccensis]|uniref:CASP-like protein n=1 Tax=Musa acuminata subsp. malaccensis TaxID=214687 RepID=A0A8D7A2N6_MUSAM|nr:unnamed protein product [Musa acuminata subsp. malaccensis]
MLSSPSTPAPPPLLSPPPPPLPLPKFHHHLLLLPVRRRRLLASLTAPLLQLLLVSPSPARARGLFRMPPARLANRYFLVRAGESVYETAGVLRTNPVAKTSVDSGLSPEGARQAARAALELKQMGACEDSCWIWPSITQQSYQAAEIIASVNSIDRSRIVPEYSFLDARGLGAFEGRNLGSISEVYESDSLSPDNKPPPVDDGTPNESVADVFVRVTQLMSILETQYSGDTVIIVSPDSDNLSVLQAGLVGLDLRRYLVAVNVLAFAYSAFQVCEKIYRKICTRHIMSRRMGCYFDLSMDQASRSLILAYLLMSASSAAASRNDVWVSRFGSDGFTHKANASIAMSFLAFVALALSSLVSAYKLFGRNITFLFSFQICSVATYISVCLLDISIRNVWGIAPFCCLQVCLSMNRVS